MGRAFGVGLFLVVLFIGCGRDTDFLYRVTTPSTQSHTVAHVLKRIKKESAVDILWVVANNKGMDNFSEPVRRGALSFVTEIRKRTKWDWKMGLISMDPVDAPVAGFPGQPPINHLTPDVEKVFEKALKGRGNSGAYAEQAFSSIQKHLDAEPSFLREDAALILMLISDGPEQSDVLAKEMAQFLVKKKQHLDNVLIYGIFASNLRWGCMKSNESWNYTGSSYEELIKMTKGGEYHLCFDFGVPVIAKLGTSFTTRMVRRWVALEKRPVLDTLRVTHNGADVMGGTRENGGYWVYDFDKNHVYLHDLSFAPGDVEDITVSYESLVDEAAAD